MSGSGVNIAGSLSPRLPGVVINHNHLATGEIRLRMLESRAGEPKVPLLLSCVDAGLNP